MMKEKPAADNCKPSKLNLINFNLEFYLSLLVFPISFLSFFFFFFSGKEKIKRAGDPNRSMATMIHSSIKEKQTVRFIHKRNCTTIIQIGLLNEA